MTAGRNDEILTRWNLEKILTNRVRGIDSNPYYQKKIPDSLKSRFDMVYNFEDLDIIEKKEYVHQITLELTEDLKQEFGINLNKTTIIRKLDGLEMMANLRNIKRKVEEVVFDEFYREYTIN